MCGIGAIFGANASYKLIDTLMTDADRRGPEDRRIVEFSNGYLAHALLSFVAIGKNHQPLLEGSNTISWNGEIYNWRDLNTKLHLQAKNDTEVLLRGYISLGDSFLRMIDGQFAFIVYSLSEEDKWQISLGRDKCGISPLVFGFLDPKTVAVASTHASLSDIGVLTHLSVPAGSIVKIEDELTDYRFWYKLPKVAPSNQLPSIPNEVLNLIEREIKIRIPEEASVLFTTLGGIDSQTVTTLVARETEGDFGGAITIVPWNEGGEDLSGLGDAEEAIRCIKKLENEGIKVNHHIVELSPAYLTTQTQTQTQTPLDNVIRILGPDVFNICCGVVEDLVAHTAKSLGCKAIMTAGGPDEAGRSYKPWTLLHKNNLEDGFHAICDQFSSSEGVRASLVFGMHGIENRVPLAELIEYSTKIIHTEKQIVHNWGGDNNPLSIEMDDKIFWRNTIQNLLPFENLKKPKETIHSATGAVAAIYIVARYSEDFQRERLSFIGDIREFCWEKLIFMFGSIDDENKLSESQLYCLWRWSKLEPKLFLLGEKSRYGSYFYETGLIEKMARPLSHDWFPLAESFC